MVEATEPAHSQSRRAMLATLGAGAAAAVVGSSLFPDSAEAAVTTFTDAVDILGSVAGSTQLLVRAAAAQTANIVEIQSSAATKLIVIDKNGHIGLTKTNPANASIYIGSGSGGLPDATGMGLSVKIDTTTTGDQPDGIHCNINVLSGTPSENILGIVAQMDVDGGIPSGTSDCVALWGETHVNSASPSAAWRDTWGLNTDVEIFPLSGPSINPYAGAAVGAEIGCHNGGGTHNPGGVLTVVSQGYKVNGTGDNTVAFGALISCGTGSRTSDSNAQNQIKTNLLMPSKIWRVVVVERRNIASGRGAVVHSVGTGTTAMI